jgi:hypothetical protein
LGRLEGKAVCTRLGDRGKPYIFSFLIFFHPDIFPSRSIWRHVGRIARRNNWEVAFLRRDEQYDPSKNLSEPADSGLGGPRL